MFSLLRTSHPPTGVEHSIYASFFNAGEKNLVVAGSNLLKVYRLVPENVQKRDPHPKLKLECMGEWRLMGWIQSLAAVRLIGASRDSILLTFKDAKLSLVEYCPETHDLITLSLHHFEDIAAKEGFIQNEEIPLIRVDPENRCAAMAVYGKKIIVLPFKRDISTLAEEGISSEGDISLEGLRIGSASSKILPSYTIDLSQVISSNSVDNIIDIQFLHGYNQPTLLILYEPSPTYTGRVAVKRDTCRLDVISIDVKERLSALIWSRELLPFDCVQAIPVPVPIGGILVFAVNSLFYVNQGIPIYGVSLNAMGDKGVTTDILIRPLEGVKLSLDCAVAEFLSPDQLVISLKGGELYVLTLLVDAMRSVKGFHVDKAAASVLTTCLSTLGNGYLFLGSRLGNSLLLKYTSREAGQIGGARKPQEPAQKRKRLDTHGDWLDAESEELEVYGSTVETVHHKISTFSFEVCDNLLNIGPCGYVSMGEPAFLSDEFSTNSPDPDIELVSTAGHGKNGALCVLQRTVRPQVVTAFELPGCIDMWTLMGPDAKGSSAEHAFLLLSRKESSMLLQTGQEINELDSSGFCTTESTIFASNIGGNSHIIQVLSKSILVLKESNLVQTMPVEFGSPLADVTCIDPYVSVLTEDGQAGIYVFKDGKLSMIKTRIGEVPGRVKSPFVAMSLYKDRSGLLTTESKNISKKKSSSISSSQNQKVKKAEDLDDEDELLYGSSEAQIGMFISGEEKDTQKEVEVDKEQESWQRYFDQVKKTFWLVTLRQNGNLELYSVPDFTLRFVSQNFPLLQNILLDNMSTRVQVHSTDPSIKFIESLPKVTELRLFGLGSKGRRPILMARLADHEVVMYELYAYEAPNLSPDQLKVRFKKIPHGLVLRERKSRNNREDKQTLSSSTYTKTFRYFNDIAGYEGIFIAGPYPHWLFLTGRGELRVHPMSIDGSIGIFAPFHNVNCPQGFLYYNRISELRICVLPAHLVYDAPWPVRKVPLRCSPHQVVFHMESKTFAVITSVAEPSNKVWKFNGDDKELNIEDRDDRFLYPNLDKFSLQLFSPISWEAIPGTKLQLDDWEYVTCMKHLYLSSEGMHSGMRGFLVVGTNFNYGEDITSRGHIKIYDVIEVVPEPGQPLTKHKIKTVYDKEQKGPVTALAAVSGYLVTTVGQKIYIWQFKNGDLHGIAFIDTNIYIHQIHTLKNFLLIADVYQSISVLQYQPDYRTLSIISSDSHPLEVYAAEFVIDNGQLGFVATDAQRNLSIFVYSPESKESDGGEKLVRKADIHIGQHINCLWRVRAKLTDTTCNQRLLPENEKKHITWYATLDGSLGHLLPVTEKVYRRLLTLNNVLTNSLEHTAGLNPRGYRTIRTISRDLRNPSRGIIDGDLVYSFSDLSVTEKAEFSRKIGTSTSEIMDDLAELDRNAAHF